MRIVLASASPRRVELLRAAGIACDVRPVDVDEGRMGSETAEAYVSRVAALKADAGAAAHPGRIVIGADTVVVVDGDILGKPIDESDAGRMLRKLAGRSHEVLTGVAIRSAGGRRDLVDRTIVWFGPLSEETIHWYVASGEPMDKAGAYAVQGLASRFVTRIEGAYANVVGLPVALVAEALANLGLRLETGQPSAADV